MGGSNPRQGEYSLLRVLREADKNRPEQDGSKQSLGRGLIRLAQLAEAVHRYETATGTEASVDSLHRLTKASA